MAIRCSGCGADNPNDATTCDGCKAPLGREAVLSSATTAVDKRAGFPIGSLILGVLCLAYLFNAGAGVLEFIPDNLPIVGNLDEGLAATVTWYRQNEEWWTRVMSGAYRDYYDRMYGERLRADLPGSGAPDGE